MNLSTYLKGIDYNIIEKGKNYSGKKLFSKIIPDKINIKHKKTEIKDGDLINGFVNKTVVNNLIIGYSWDRYGADKTRNFIEFQHPFNKGMAILSGLGDLIQQFANPVRIGDVTFR